MGIEGLNPFIKKKAPDAFFTLPISRLVGKKVAIDAYDWMYANMAISRKKVIAKTDVTTNEPDINEIRQDFLKAVLNFALKWINNNITPIFVFDGKKKPVEKDQIKAGRYEKQKEKRKKIDDIYLEMKGDVLENSNHLVDELRRALSNYLPVNSEDIDSFKSLLTNLGIPWLQAEGDAEPLCSSLCIEGKVAAVFSSDTDNLAYGCPLVIYNFSKGYHVDELGRKTLVMECMRIDKVLEGLNITYRTFVDLCIMCGCDFNGNTHMPGYAAIKSFNLLYQHKSIDKIPPSEKYDTSILNHKRCREIFTYISSDKIIVGDILLDLDKSKILSSNKYLEKIGLIDELEKIYGTFTKFSGSKDGLIEDLNLKPIDFSKPKLRIRIINTNNNNNNNNNSNNNSNSNNNT